MTDSQDPAKKGLGRAPWQKPQIHKIELTDEEKEAVRSSDDPMALLLKLKRPNGADGRAS
jgi:hypothetical protein